jgi:hypothetical protein
MIKTTAGGGENAVLAAAAAGYVQLLLADRTSLRGHPAIVNLSAFGAGRLGGGSLVSQFTLFGLDGYDVMPAVAEGVTATETALTTALRTVTAARRGLFREMSDLMGAVDPTGQINPMRLAQDGFQSAMVTLTSLIAGLGSGFSTSVGTSGVDFDHDVFMAAKAALIEAKVPGPYICILHPTALSRWVIDLESRPGITQWRPSNEAMQILKGPGFQGTYDGIDVYSSDKCPASGGDFVSCMFGAGAVGYVEQQVVAPSSAITLLSAGPIFVEEIRNGKGGATGVMTHYYVGVTEIEDGRGVKILALG